MPYVSSRMELGVNLSQREPLHQNYYGKISLAEDRITTENKIQNGQPVLYRIDFPSNEAPKLTRITINGQDVCIDNEYPRPSTSLFLQHSLLSTRQTYTVPYNIRRPEDNTISFRQDNNQIFATVQPTRTNQISTQSTRQPSRPTTVVTTGPRLNAGQSFQCGQESGVSAFIYGGSQITRGQYPWLTAIYVKSAGLRFLCGGSLLSTRTVLSAAHCFKTTSLTADRLVVNVGRYNLEDYRETNFQTREVQNIVIHPDFSTNVFPDADLAVLHLDQPVQYTIFVRPICLWSEPVDASLIVGTTGVVAGWGGDENGREFTPIPKKVDTNIVSEGDCLRSSQAYSALTSQRTLCAGNRDGTGPCMGDSGSGLMINRNDRWYLRGVVSAGQTKQQRCNLLEYVVFCDVAKHRDWVEQNLL
ncbi:serine protease gd-like [Haematobia irritans]|uniref:serine protease gd-like n=1 Tax=Haematobia irritans TaxID=7368 RepID=UPI003F4F5ACB